jgi:hypothetical protein
MVRKYVLIQLGLTLALAAPCFAQSSTGYTYDALGRVKTATHARAGAPTQVTTYVHDATNNRTRVHVGPPGSSNRAPTCPARTKTVLASASSTTVNPVTHPTACSDADGDPISLVSAGGWTDGATGAVNLTDGTVTLSNLQPETTHSFSFTVIDGTAQASFTFFVTRPSACPTCRPAAPLAPDGPAPDGPG